MVDTPPATRGPLRLAVARGRREEASDEMSAIGRAGWFFSIVVHRQDAEADAKRASRLLRLGRALEAKPDREAQSKKDRPLSHPMSLNETPPDVVTNQSSRLTIDAVEARGRRPARLDPGRAPA
jgi:hypothetical protein